jgi:hypothetical protein
MVEQFMAHSRNHGLSLLTCLVVLLPNLVAARKPPRAAKGFVAYRISSCDYFVVETSSDYDLLEWFGGHDPGKGDYLIGEFESYGFHEIYDETADQGVRVYTEDYALTKSDALEKLTEHCE